MRLKILICPLHWGLGHATRCRTIIDEMVERGHEVHLASDGLAETFLRLHYPDLPIHPLAKLDIKYGRLFWLRLFTQTFHLLLWVARDRGRIQKLHNLYQYDLIISDSRPSGRINEVTSVLVIHQPRPIIPWKGFQWMVYKAMDTWMSGFDRIYIPDITGDVSLSGHLSKLSSSDRVIRIGFLTKILPEAHGTRKETPYDILAIVSGPEPMRSRFEHSLTTVLQNKKVMIVGGRPDISIQDIGYQSFVYQSQLIDLIGQCQYVISRGGYSTLMDLAAWSKKLILVPTPGQTEQLYLAERLMELGLAVIWDMDKETWSAVMRRADQCKPFFLANDSDLLKHAIYEIEQYCEKKINFPR